MRAGKRATKTNLRNNGNEKGQQKKRQQEKWATKAKVILWSVDRTEGSNCWKML